MLVDPAFHPLLRLPVANFAAVDTATVPASIAATSSGSAWVTTVLAWR